MVKKIALIVFGIVLLGGIGFALWWVNEREREVDIPKESFIPYNSAVVINVNANANLSPKIATAFDREIKAFRKITNAYGIDVNQLVEVSHCGINKINVDTDIRLAVTRNMKELFAKDAALRNSASVGQIYELLEKKKAAYDPRVFITPIMDTVMYGNVPDDDVARICKCIEDGVKEAIAPLLVKFGSYGKAQKVELVTIDEMAERYRKAGI